MDRLSLEGLCEAYEERGLELREQRDLLNAVDSLLTRLDQAATRAGDLNAAGVHDAGRIVDLRAAIMLALEEMAETRGQSHDAVLSCIRRMGSRLAAVLERDSRPAEGEGRTP